MLVLKIHTHTYPNHMTALDTRVLEERELA